MNLSIYKYLPDISLTIRLLKILIRYEILRIVRKPHHRLMSTIRIYQLKKRGRGYGLRA
jgi:hypothetical protein